MVCLLVMDDQTKLQQLLVTPDAGSAFSESEFAWELARGSALLEAFLRTPTSQANLTESRYNVLYLLQHSNDGTCSQADLAKSLFQSESNLSTLLDRMQQDELVTRVRSTTDRRKSLIRLTPHGNLALQSADLERNRALRKALRSFDADRLQTCRDTLKLLLKRLSSELNLDSSDGARREKTFAAEARIDVPTPHLKLASQAAQSTSSQNAN